MEILNCYSGIGGNRKLWGNEHQITAIELDPTRAAYYKTLFPKDEVIVADAHEYLLRHYKEFDFIWTSPPCPTHSRMMTSNESRKYDSNKMVYPDMTLYQEIILLKKWFKGKFVVENVIPYYEPLVPPTICINRHNFWTNFFVSTYNKQSDERHDNIKQSNIVYEFDLSNVKIKNKRQALRNLVDPEIGKEIVLDNLS